MVWLLSSVLFGSIKIFSAENMSKKSKSLAENLVEVSFWFKIVIWVFDEGWINILASETFSAIACIKNVFDSAFNTILANFFLLMSFTHLIVDKALAAVSKF